MFFYLAATESFQLNLKKKKKDSVWLRFAIIAALFFSLLTPSFEGACTISSIRNGWVDVSVVCCTATAKFCEVTHAESKPECWAGREGSNC